MTNNTLSHGRLVKEVDVYVREHAEQQQLVRKLEAGGSKAAKDDQDWELKNAVRWLQATVDPRLSGLLTGSP